MAESKRRLPVHRPEGPISTTCLCAVPAPSHGRQVAPVCVAEATGRRRQVAPGDQRESGETENTQSNQPRKGRNKIRRRLSRPSGAGRGKALQFPAARSVHRGLLLCRPCRSSPQKRPGAMLSLKSAGGVQEFRVTSPAPVRRPRRRGCVPRFLLYTAPDRRFVSVKEESL